MAGRWLTLARGRPGFGIVALLTLTACDYSTLGGSWKIRRRVPGVVESGNTIVSLHRVNGFGSTKVDDFVLLSRYYGDDCVVWDRRTFYAACGDRKPVLVVRSGQKLGPEGVVSEGPVFVRDRVPWREREIVPIGVIKSRAMAAPVYNDSWRTDAARSEELPFTNVPRRLGMEERDHDGRTPLMDLVSQQEPEPVEALIRAGADVNARDNYGYTPIMLAVHRMRDPNERIVRALLLSGAQVNVSLKNGETPLMRAAINGDAKTALILIEAGADVNTKTDKGETALFFAKRVRLEPVIAALRTAGARE